jgi:hypothetical protein
MDIKKFIKNRKKNVINNNNFNKWNENNKINNKSVIIGFHGSVGDIFKEISFNKSNNHCWCGKGFYISNDIHDVNYHYANKEGGDLILRKNVLINKIKSSNIYANHFFDCTEIEKKIINDKILYSDIIKLNNGKWKELANSLSKKNKIFNILSLKKYIHWSSFLRGVANKTYIHNNGYIIPLYIKMSNPAYYTNNNKATLISHRCKYNNNYKKIKKYCLNLSKKYDYENEIVVFFNEIEKNIYDLNKNIKFTLYKENQIKLKDVFDKSRINKIEKLMNIFNEAVSQVFDGIVFNIYDEKKTYNMTNTRPDTIHYIVFKKNNIKSAIGNNGGFSLKDNDFNK